MGIKDPEFFSLKCATDAAWPLVALKDFDQFLLDHAACERKAAALAMSLVVKYPDRPALIEPMISLAREELAHFHDVYRLIAKRGLQLIADEKDPYLKQLLKHVRHGRDEHFLDRLLVSGIVEARGCERFSLIAEALQKEGSELAPFYTQLAKAEAGHYRIFILIARQYFDRATIETRLDELLDAEAKVIQSLELRAAVH